MPIFMPILILCSFFLSSPISFFLYEPGLRSNLGWNREIRMIGIRGIFWVNIGHNVFGEIIGHNIFGEIVGHNL